MTDAIIMAGKVSGRHFVGHGRMQRLRGQLHEPGPGSVSGDDFQPGIT